MFDLQNIIALALVTMAGGYVLKCAMAACGLQKTAKGGGSCGSCGNCASGSPAVVQIQLAKPVPGNPEKLSGAIP